MKTGLQRQRGQVLKELKRAGSDKATDDKVWVVEGGKEVGRRKVGRRRWEGGFIYHLAASSHSSPGGVG